MKGMKGSRQQGYLLTWSRHSLCEGSQEIHAKGGCQIIHGNRGRLRRREYEREKRKARIRHIIIIVSSPEACHLEQEESGMKDTVPGDRAKKKNAPPVIQMVGWGSQELGKPGARVPAAKTAKESCSL